MTCLTNLAGDRHDYRSTASPQREHAGTRRTLSRAVERREGGLSGDQSDGRAPAIGI